VCSPLFFGWKDVYPTLLSVIHWRCCTGLSSASEIFIKSSDLLKSEVICCEIVLIATYFTKQLEILLFLLLKKALKILGEWTSVSEGGAQAEEFALTLI
jgi:hypothetical protein